MVDVFQHTSEDLLRHTTAALERVLYAWKASGGEHASVVVEPPNADSGEIFSGHKLIDDSGELIAKLWWARPAHDTTFELKLWLRPDLVALLPPPA